MATYRAFSATLGALQPLMTIAIRTLHVRHDVLSRFHLFTNRDHITATLAL